MSHVKDKVCVDFHVHTIYSKDALNTFDVLRYGQRYGCYVAITDHNTFRGVKTARRLGLTFIPGIEVTTDRGDLIGLFVEEDNTRYHKGMDFFEMLDRVHEDGGISILPHPFDHIRKHAVRDESLTPHVDVVEGYNSRSVFESANQRALEIALKYRKPITSGSDAHLPVEVWNGYVVFDDDRVLRDRDELLTALKDHPEIHHQPTFLFAPAFTWVYKLSLMFAQPKFVQSW